MKKRGKILAGDSALLLTIVIQDPTVYFMTNISNGLNKNN
jgi:hypothetical protein